LLSIKSKIETGAIRIRGEFVVIVEGNHDDLILDSEILRINKILAEKISYKDAVLLTAKITGKKKNEIYRLAHKNDSTE
jgi:16S rRNA C1402 (ribose-2'-O) methylase RsmI